MSELGIGATRINKVLYSANGKHVFKYSVGASRWEVPARECSYCIGKGEVDVDMPRVDFLNGGWLDGGLQTCDRCGGFGYVDVEFEDE